MNLGTTILPLTSPLSIRFLSISFPFFPPFPFLLTFSSASSWSLGFEGILDVDGMEVIPKLDRFFLAMFTVGLDHLPSQGEFSSGDCCQQDRNEG